MLNFCDTKEYREAKEYYYQGSPQLKYFINKNIHDYTCYTYEKMKEYLGVIKYVYVSEVTSTNASLAYDNKAINILKPIISHGDFEDISGNCGIVLGIAVPERNLHIIENYTNRQSMEIIYPNNAYYIYTLPYSDRKIKSIDFFDYTITGNKNENFLSYLREYYWNETDQEKYIKLKPGKIYFISDGEYIKIGFTSGIIQKRLKSLQTGNPKQLKLIGYVEGTIKTEYEIHSKLEMFRCVGEWFYITEDQIRKIIRSY